MRKPPKIKPQRKAKRGRGEVAQPITEMQWAFIEAFKKDPTSARRAAIAAGVAEGNAGVQASRWMDIEQFPLVVNEIRKALEKIEEGSLLSGQALLTHCHRVLLTRYADFFLPSENARNPDVWQITPEGLKALPDHIAQMIEGVMYKEKDELDANGAVIGRKRMAYVKLMSKTEALKIAAKFQLGDTLNVNATVVQINFEDLHRKVRAEHGTLPGTLINDPVEEDLAAAEREADEAVARRNPTIKVNGTNGAHKS